MSHRLVYRPEAEQELFSAAEWYAARGHSLAGEFLRAFDATAAAVLRNPLQYPEVHPGMHRALLRRFPYSLIYSIPEDEIVVLACAHWRQSQSRWRSRT